MGQLQVQKVGWWHERLAEWMIANPDRHLKEAAPVFNCTPAMIYIIHNSDAFKEHWAKVSGRVTAGIADPIVEKCRAAAEAALDGLIEKVSLPGQSEMFLLDAANKMMQNLGYSARSGGVAGAGATAVQVNVSVDAASLQAARARVEQITSRPLVNMNVPAQEVPALSMAEAQDATDS